MLPLSYFEINSIKDYLVIIVVGFEDSSNCFGDVEIYFNHELMALRNFQGSIFLKYCFIYLSTYSCRLIEFVCLMRFCKRALMKKSMNVLRIIK